MKKVVMLNMAMMALFFLWSCKEDAIANFQEEVDVVLQNTEDYVYDFGFSGDEESATIITQAQHFSVSEIFRDTTSNWSVKYRYRPELGFIGNDYVEIETCTGGEGVKCSNIMTVKINFTITD